MDEVGIKQTSETVDTVEKIKKQIVIIECFPCKDKQVFEFDFEKGFTEEDMKLMQTFQYNHSLHSGYIFTNKIIDNEDQKRIMDTIREWVLPNPSVVENKKEPETK